MYQYSVFLLWELSSGAMFEAAFWSVTLATMNPEVWGAGGALEGDSEDHTGSPSCAGNWEKNGSLCSTLLSSVKMSNLEIETRP